MQRRQSVQGLLRTVMTCTFTAEDNLTEETAQHDKHTASRFNQTSGLKKILHLR